jgi:UDP-N-acetylglucosamine 2-epimerase (non-hydrolysing)
MTVVGTRPEIIRLSRVMARLDEHCDHVLVHTGQNYDYELNEIFFQDLAIRKPDHFLNAAGASGAETIGNVIIGVDRILAEVQPDALLVLGDTNSCMAVIPAKRRKIPTFHMEAGNRCFDMRVPEEINRRIVDHTADINLTYSTIARDYLMREGLPPDMVIKTGSPMFEVLNHYREGIESSDVLGRLGLKAEQFFLVSAHREENIDSDKNFVKLVAVLNAVAERYGFPVIVSAHPRTQKRVNAMDIQFHPLIRLLKPLGFKDYNKLQLKAKAVLSDSGTINEESSILNFPALNIREAHERPEGMEEAAAVMVGLEVERVMQGLAILEKQARGDVRSLRLVTDYSMPNVAEKVVRIVHSYRDYVMRNVWKRF